MNEIVFCAQLSKIQPFHIYPYCIFSWINIGLGNIEGPWLRDCKFQGTLLRTRSSHCIKQNVFHAPLSKIQPFHIYPYCIIYWRNIELVNIEGPWLRGWQFQGTLLGAKSRHCIKQNVFRAQHSKIQPFHIYPYCIISWINIGLGNIEGPSLGGWKYQGTLLGARSPYCNKQNVFGAPLSKIQPFHIYPYCIISWINIGLGNIEGPWLGGWKFQGRLLGARSPIV
jgi:hypothetical protein